MKVSKQTLSVSGFASKDNARYNLNAVRYEPVEGGGVFVATNGHVLAAVEARGDDAPAQPFSILRSDVEAVAKGAKDGAELVGKATDANGHAEFTVGTARHEPPKMKDVEYPNWRQIVPKDEPKFSVTLNAAYLEQLAKFAKGFGGGMSRAVRLEFRDELGPVVLRARNGDDEATLVVMPMRDVTEYRGV